jgi:methionyl-tRNA formyltransferase
VRVLFWGTPLFAVPTLRALAEEGHDVVAVVTQPDRPAGRGRVMRVSEVKTAALSEAIPVLEPERPKGDEFLAAIRAWEPDVSVVVAYGHILVREVLDVPVHGSINLHASLLPKLRGAAPVEWAITRGHDRTGVTVMRMVEAMDAGPILHQVEEPIGDQETASDLRARLSEIGAQALVEALALLSLDELEEREQDHGLATYAPKIDRAAARVEWTADALEVSRLIRAMDEVPGAWSERDGTPVKLFRPEVLDEDGPTDTAPGVVLRADPREGLVTATGSGPLRIGEVQPPGKRRMPAQEWVRGRGVRAGDRFS